MWMPALDPTHVKVHLGVLCPIDLLNLRLQIPPLLVPTTGEVIEDAVQNVYQLLQLPQSLLERHMGPTHVGHGQVPTPS